MYDLTVIIPVFNESKTIKVVLDKIAIALNGRLNYEVILVDDASIDNSYKDIASYSLNYPHIKILRHNKNLGKGAAIRTALSEVKGIYTIIQDGDLEYDPNDIHKLYMHAKQLNADVVIGSRLLDKKDVKFRYALGVLANKFLTFLSNILSRQKVSDMETCYKLIRTNIFKEITIKENRFGFEPEIIAKLARYSRKNKQLIWSELPVAYWGRTFKEGKKIGAKDGLRAIYCIIRYNLGYN